MRPQGRCARRSLGSIILAANESTTKATPAKKVTPLGKQTKLKVVVEAANEVPTGKVKVMKGDEGRSARARSTPRARSRSR